MNGRKAEMSENAKRILSLLLGNVDNYDDISPFDILAQALQRDYPDFLAMIEDEEDEDEEKEKPGA